MSKQVCSSFNILLVNQDTINIEGSITRIEKGFYNFDYPQSSPRNEG